MKKIIFALIVSMQSLLLHAQVMSLDSILTTIEKNNPELQMYDAQVNEFNEYAKGAKAWEAPQIGAGFFMTPYNPSMWKADNSGSMNSGGGSGMGTGSPSTGMGSFMIQGQQMIPNPAKIRANQEYMQSMSSVEAANKNVIRNNLFTEARMNYYEWVILKNKLLVLDEQEQLMKYIITTTEVRYPYEQEKLSSIYKARTSLVEIQNMRLMFESEINWRRVSLNQLMNRDKSILFDVETSIAVKEYEKLPVDTSALLSNRSDIAAINKSILVAQYKQTYERSKLKPDFSIQYGHMFSFSNTSPNLFTLMGMVTIPFAPWSSKMYRSNELGLNYKIQAYQKQREVIVNESTGMLESIKWRIASQKQQIALFESTMLPALEKNYKATLLAYEQNTEDLFMVLDAANAWQLAKLELLNKKKELLLLQVEYEKIVEKI